MYATPHAPRTQPIAPGHGWLLHCWDSNLQSPKNRVKAFLLRHQGTYNLLLTYLCKWLTVFLIGY